MAEDSSFDQLYHDLLNYALRPCRLLFIDDAEIWCAFHSEYSDVQCYADLTPYELCQRFSNDLLPEIFTLDLTDETKNQLKLLELHPQFQRTARGYKRVPLAQRAASQFELTSLLDTTPESGVAEAAQPTINGGWCHYRPEISALQEPLQLESPTPSSHTKLVPYMAPVQQGGGSRFRNSPIAAAVLSACFLSNAELCACQLLHLNEIHRHLRLAKSTFENIAQFSNFRDPFPETLKHLTNCRKLREAFVDIISKRYF